MTRFQAADGRGESWPQALSACLAQIEPLSAGRGLGFLYVADPLAQSLDLIHDELRRATGVEAWVGVGARAVCASGREHDGGAVAVLLADLDARAVRLFDRVRDGLQDLPPDLRRWCGAEGGVTGVVHGDPRLPRASATIARLAMATGGFLVGGLGSSESPLQIAGGPTEGGLSGALLGRSVPVIAGLTQGCSPIGPYHVITSCHQDLIETLDGRPALAVLEAEAGELLARDPRRMEGYIHAARPARHGGAGYVVRELLELDAGRGVLRLADGVAAGERLMFVRRDGAAAQRDLDRMLAGARPVLGALYHADDARGAGLFGPGSQELGRIRRALGDVPLAGAFLDGEIHHDHLYGHAGVLTLFLG
jgi:small ligand-binding sensory domain FIST